LSLGKRKRIMHLFNYVIVASQNSPVSNDTQHDEPGGCQSRLVDPGPSERRPRNLAHALPSKLLGVPPDLVPDQGGVDVFSVSFLHKQTYKHQSSRGRLPGLVSAVKSRLFPGNRLDLCA